MLIDPHRLPLFVAGALLLNITPGPDMAFTLASSLRGGAKTGLAAAAGVFVGCLGWAGLTAGGLAALLAASQTAFLIIRVAGGCYLLYLAVQAALALDAAPQAKGAVSLLGAFRSGCMTNLFNPKVGLFFLAFLPSFVTPAAGPVWLQTFTLGAIFSVSGACVLAIVAFASGGIRDRLSRSRRLRITLNAVAASVFGVLGLSILSARR